MSLISFQVPVKYVNVTFSIRYELVKYVETRVRFSYDFICKGLRAYLSTNVLRNCQI